MPIGRDVPVHYLRANHTEWTPPHVVALDTETRQASDELQVLRCWCASVVARPQGMSSMDSRVDASGDTATGLAVQLDAWSASRPTLWCYAHNLGFDLAVTRLPIELGKLGWIVSDFAIDGRAPWMRLSKGRRHITLADSWSWVQSPLAVIAGQVGITKPPLPDDEDSAEAWLLRCSSDVDILMAMMCTLMDWWSSTGRGRWSVTGAASGWNAYRHTPTPFKVVIDPEEKGVTLERASIYGGRRAVNRVGSLAPGQYVEIDISRAYTVAARNVPLPVRRMRAFDSMPIDDSRIDSERWGIIAEVTIETDVPRWPVREAGRVWYPVGRFRTTLASPEIADARSRGALLSIHKGHSYQLAPHMAPWAQWCLDVADEHTEGVPGVVRMAAKQWGRSVIGKWAQKRYTKVTLGPAPTEGWGYEQAWMANTHVRASIVDLGGQRYMTFPDGDGENAFPAVLAFIESHVRMALGKAIDAVGSDAFVQCDTDGLLASVVDLMKRARSDDTRDAILHGGGDFLTLIVDKISTITAPFTLRVKRTYSRIEVIGPQHVKLDGKRRYSGIPGSGEEMTNGDIGAWVWPKLSQQMQSRDAVGYVQRFQRYRVPRALAAGWITTQGRVLPVEWAQRADGSYGPLRWPQTRWAGCGEELAQTQTPDVLRLAQDYGRGE